MKKLGNKQWHDGKWIEKDEGDGGSYVMKRRYKYGEKVGVWKTYFNQKLYQKDRIIDSITRTKIYFPNGKLMEKGQSKFTIEKDFGHWFYFGEWNYYDETGNIEYKKSTD